MKTHKIREEKLRLLDQVRFFFVLLFCRKRGVPLRTLDLLAFNELGVGIFTRLQKDFLSQMLAFQGWRFKDTFLRLLAFC